MTHPDNLPDEVSNDLSGLNAPDALIETLTVAGCALRHGGAPLEVYIPDGFDTDDYAALYNTIIQHDHVITRAYPFDGDDFSMLLEIIPYQASIYKRNNSEEMADKLDNISAWLEDKGQKTIAADVRHLEQQLREEKQ